MNKNISCGYKFCLFIFIAILLISPLNSHAQSYPFRVKGMIAIGDGRLYVCATDNTYGNFIGYPYSSTEVLYASYSSARRRARNKLNKFLNIIQSSSNSSLISSARSKRRKWRTVYRNLAQCWNATGDYEIDTSGIDPDIFRACNISNGVFSSSAQAVSSSPYKAEPIINGSLCDNNNSGVVLLIIYSERDGDAICTGTVVNQRTIITAGHCLEGDVDSVDVVSSSKEVNTTNYHVHPNYGQDQIEINDVSIVLLSEDIGTGTFDILSNSTLSLDELGIIAGYGLDDNGDAESLRAAPVLISSFTDSAISIRYSANNDFGNTCSGDSGGPLFVKRSSSWKLVGVTSNGVKNNCGAGDLSNFANLLDSSNKSFINTYVPGLIP